MNRRGFFKLLTAGAAVGCVKTAATKDDKFIYQATITSPKRFRDFDEAWAEYGRLWHKDRWWAADAAEDAAKNNGSATKSNGI